MTYQTAHFPRATLAPRHKRPRLAVLPALHNAEFSDVGRDARFVPGWWIIPCMAFGLAFWIGAFSLIV